MSETLGKLAVIILNYNNAELSLDAARKIMRFNLGLKVVIVDNCSSDDSFTILNSVEDNPNLVIAFNSKNTGYAAGNNYGANIVFEKFPEVDVLCVMNPDVIVPDANTLFNIYDKLKVSDNIGALTAEVIFNGEYRKERNQSAWHFFNKVTMLLQGGVFGRLFYKDLYYDKFNEKKDNIAFVDVVQGCFFMIKKSDFLKIQGFDENTFLYYEEMILAKRLKNIGKNSAVFLGSFINHNHKEKDRSILKLNAKYFDMKCYLDSRLYYLENYMNTTSIYKSFAKLILIGDYYIKKAVFWCILKR